MTSAVPRPACPGDGARMGQVHVAAWLATYRGVMPDRVLDRLDAEVIGRRWQASLSRADADSPPAEPYVAEIEDEVVAIGLLGPDRADPGSGCGEIWMINVDPDHWGRGVGQALLASMCDRLSEQGYEEAILWVAEENPRARRFYEAAGWRSDGATKSETFGDGDGDVTEVRYRVSLR